MIKILKFVLDLTSYENSTAECTPCAPFEAPFQFGKSRRAPFAAAFAAASASAEICSTSFQRSRDMLSFAATAPNLAVHSVSTSRRRVGWLMLFVQTS